LTAIANVANRSFLACEQVFATLTPCSCFQSYFPEVAVFLTFNPDSTNCRTYKAKQDSNLVLQFGCFCCSNHFRM